MSIDNSANHRQSAEDHVYDTIERDRGIELEKNHTSLETVLHHANNQFLFIRTQTPRWNTHSFQCDVDPLSSGKTSPSSTGKKGWKWLGGIGGAIGVIILVYLLWTKISTSDDGPTTDTQLSTRTVTVSLLDVITEKVATIVQRCDSQRSFHIGNTPLHNAVLNQPANSTRAFEYILESFLDNLNKENDKGCTPRNVARICRRPDIDQLLASQGGVYGERCRNE